MSIVLVVLLIIFVVAYVALDKFGFDWFLGRRG